jgi:hypothetical protein
MPATGVMVTGCGLFRKPDGAIRAVEKASAHRQASRRDRRPDHQDGDRPGRNAYANALQIQGWVGDLALSIEQELFAEDALKLKLRQRYGTQVEGFAVEEALRRLREQLLPLFERANRQLLQNLQALQRRCPGSSPMVAIGRAGQVNVAQQQVNFQRRNGRASQPVEPR